MSLEPLEKVENRRSRAPLFVLLGLLVFLILAVAVLARLCERDAPRFSWRDDISRFGINTEAGFTATDAGSGIRSVLVTMVQDRKKVTLFDKSFARKGMFLAPGPRRIAETFSVNLGSAGFRDGVAEIRVTIRDFSWWNWRAGNQVFLRYPVVLDTRPPVVRIIDSPRYIRPGSAGIVVYTLNEPAKDHGVMINGYFHPGFPLPDRGERAYGAMIGLPYDTERIKEALVTATDEAGNTGRARFGMILRKAKIIKDRINVSDSFLELKLPEFARFYPKLSGTPLEQYLYVNNEIRKENYQTVRKVCARSQPERLWEGRFGRLPRSSRRAGFADSRSYYYHGRKVDHQVHLGIDLASVRHARVQAANRGVVVFADYLGIYGNTVILDHGQGVFSLYSHMSQIDVACGDKVEKGAALGLTGNTGMAGGDHLHFSVLINGVFVNPVEWWDARWLELNILNYL